MKLEFDIAGHTCRIDTTRVHDLAIVLDFEGPQPSCFAAAKARSTVFRQGEFIADTLRGGACNVSQLELSPHLNGTHTESAAHLSRQAARIAEVSWPTLLAATLISLTPLPAGEQKDLPGPSGCATDWLIGLELLKSALEKCQPEFLQALVIRTLPNPPDKSRRQWENSASIPYFSPAACEFLRNSGVIHLLVDLPSLDRTDDGGQLLAHRAYWNLDHKNNPSPNKDSRSRSITEMIYADNGIPDGQGLLELGLPRFLSDAVPSRPRFYPLILNKESDR